ncbi:MULTISPECIES: EAL domain-containing protein [Aquitalea]|uniref:EAL domain-containing protein (Putative c-di-GMP-specific phosphodiesterase class I) n=1 Tax=Aquitalea magnusonii TaxID=332411 RepID=A0A318IXU3_9NEIS|nr:MULTISPECIES: EAL domain-containing protein [Aquitalea]PXX40115.1 EAL domain-containing protein (putative c-di-GMP-specific phosphodiesterase class I) [Aquitalea magnusonii]
MVAVSLLEQQALAQPAQLAPIERDLAHINQLLNAHQFEQHPLSLQSGRVRGRHEEWRFRSVFQPIYALENGSTRLWSVEALARVTDSFGGQLIPTVLFAAETSPRRSVFLDRQLRCLHLFNFLLQHPGPELILSLNVNAQHLVNVSETHGQFFAEVLQHLQIPASQICLEVVEDAVSDPMRLYEAVQRYRSLGFRIALDDFGQGASNLERVWLLEPDYVKLDKVLMRHALMRPGVRDKLARLVDILHLHGAKVVGEGIESAMQLDIARAAGCDFVQGFHLARPAEQLTLPL